MTNQLPRPCPSCRSTKVSVFYEALDVPTNSVLLLDDAEAARSIPRSDIRLGFCAACGHVHNTAFDHQLTEYSGRYESTQGYSETFNRFHARLASDMIDRFDLHRKDIIEIGCGNGEFLVMLCELGGNSGLGFDPAFQPGRIPIAAGTNVEFVTDFYSDAYVDRQADFIVCKMTLEHIVDVGRFIGDVRRAIGDRVDTLVCFQIPNGRYVLGDMAFWDVYYEHCSYFTHGSLSRLFRRERFDVLDLWTDYDDQYLMIAARPTDEPTAQRRPDEDDLANVSDEVDRFETEVPKRIADWRDDIGQLHRDGQTVVLWGGGSKGVSFLTTCGLTDEIAAVVDINPNKHGTFMAGSGHEIVSPNQLVDIDPAVVVVMNPIYLDEIGSTLAALDLHPVLRPLE